MQVSEKLQHALTYAANKQVSVTVVIPCYNEEPNIRKVLENVEEVQIADEIIIVDDGSTDGSRDYLDTLRGESDVVIVFHERNLGKGGAVRTGLETTTGDICLVQDADLEYDPNEFNILLKPVIDGFADVVYGSRFMGGNPHRILFFWHTIGNKFLTNLSNMFSNLNLTDMETCYKLFKREMVQSLHLTEKRFGFEPEVTAKISRIPKVRIYEVGISYYGRTFEEGKKIGWKDGFRAIYCILKYGALKLR